MLFETVKRGSAALGVGSAAGGGVAGGAAVVAAQHAALGFWGNVALLVGLAPVSATAAPVLGGAAVGFVGAGGIAWKAGYRRSRPWPGR